MCPPRILAQNAFEMNEFLRGMQLSGIRRCGTSAGGAVMSDAVALLARCHELGAELIHDGEQLKVRAPEP